MSRAVRAAVVMLLLVLGPAAAAPAADPQASLPDVEDEVMCPICGTTLEQSQSPQADRERELIRRLIAEGRTKEEIKDVLVAEYGPDVLATPEGSGFDLSAWLVPIAGLLLALGAVALTLARSRSSGGTEDDDPPPASSADLERLDRDLSSFDR